MRCIEIVAKFPHLVNLPLNLSNGVTPFHRVCSRGNHALVEFMLANGKIPIHFALFKAKKLIFF